MLTIAIPNRNRNLRTVERTLRSIVCQNPTEINVVVIDYGSELNYQEQLRYLVKEIGNCVLICCPTQGQLWNKARAINIVLKQCETTYFMVADMDMIFHPKAIEKINSLVNTDRAIYFKVGILTEEESKKDVPFDDYIVKFYTNTAATGITVFPTATLKAIHGFDEFYHGWGAEDTDVHIRFKHIGTSVEFYEQKTLFLHQWHPKHYRSNLSTVPFHDILEKINHQYLNLSRHLNKQKANSGFAWGITPDVVAYQELKKPTIRLDVLATEEMIKAFLVQWDALEQIVLSFSIKAHRDEARVKTKIKKILRRKTPNFVSLEIANRCILEQIITRYRNCPYTYAFDRRLKRIEGVIYLKPAL